MNPNPKPARRTLTSVLNERLDQDDTRERVVEMVVSKALAGEEWALKLVWDRTEGRALARHQIEQHSNQRIQLDWSRTPELQQAWDVEGRVVKDE